MTDIIELSDAVEARLKTVLKEPEWTSYIGEPPPGVPIEVPAFCVQAGLGPGMTKSGDYLQGLSGHTKWTLRVGLYVSAADWQAAYRQVGCLTGTGGLLIATLEDQDIDDALARLCKGNLVATELRGPAFDRKHRAPLMCADIGLGVGAN